MILVHILINAIDSGISLEKNVQERDLGDEIVRSLDRQDRVENDGCDRRNAVIIIPRRELCPLTNSR
jgi:hypothetical protein